MMLRKSTARSMTRIAQVVSVVSLAILVLAIVVPRREVAPPDTEPVETTSTQGNASPTAVAPPVQRVDWTVLTTSLQEIREPLATATAQNPIDEDPEDRLANNAGETSTSDEPRPQPAPPGWQYIGYAQSSAGAVSALVTINARQQFVRPGMTVESFRVAEVSTDRILLERDERRFEVKRTDPLPFDAAASTADARARARGEAARGRTARLEQQRMQDLEEMRQRRIDESRGEEFADERGTPNR